MNHKTKKLLDHQTQGCHIIYKNLHSLSNDDEVEKQHKFIRKHLEELWEVFEPYADTHFTTEFCKNPEQRYWEMYLGCCLLDKNFLISSKDQGPDFSFQIDNKTTWIEAVTPTAGDINNPNHVPPILQPSGCCEARQVPRDKIILRFMAALDEKEKKFKRYVEDKIIGKDDIKIIALSSASLGKWPKEEYYPYILSAVFPIGNTYLSIDRQTGKVIDQGFHFQSTVSKSNKVEIETLFFYDPRHSDISAVIYSDGDIGNPILPLGDDLLIIHNPLAKNPLPRGILPYRYTYWLENLENDLWELKCDEFKANNASSQ